VNITRFFRWAHACPRILVTVSLVTLCAVLVATSASAAIAIQIDGIAGESTIEGHTGWIDIGSLQWGVGRGISTSGTSRVASTPSFSEITITKVSDKTTPHLFAEAVAGEGKKVTIEFIKTDSGPLTTYEKIELENVLISGFSQSSGGDRPSESLSLNFTKITITYYPSGPTPTPVVVGFDLVTGKAF